MVSSSHLRLAAYFDTRGKKKPNASKRDFAIQFRDGTTRCVDFEPNSVVFVLGEAGKMHFDRVTKGAADHPTPAFLAVSHSVTLERVNRRVVPQELGLASMILLPDDYPISKDMQAGLLREQAIKAVKSKTEILPCLHCQSRASGHTHDMRALMDTARKLRKRESCGCWMQRQIKARNR